MASNTETRALVWEVVLPDKRATSTFGPKPRAQVVIHAADGSNEQINVPVAVGRIIASKQKADEIHPGSRAELLYVIGETSISCARARIERLIDRREYSSSEVRSKLRMDGYSSRVVDDCVARACRVGLISDVRYADSFIRSKIYAGWGMQRIERELKARGIDIGEVPGWPYEYLDPEDELRRAMELASTRCVSGPRAYVKLVRYLCTRGFSTSVASRAAGQVLASRDDQVLVDF